MKYILLVPFVLLLVGCLGGQSYNSHTFDESLSKSGGCADPTETELCDAMEIIKVQCIDCHSGTHNAWANFDTNEKWVASERVIAGDPDNSPLIFWLQNAGGTMPEDKPALTDDDYQTLRLWISNITL